MNLRAFGVDRAIGNLARTADKIENQFLSDAAFAAAQEIAPIARQLAPKGPTGRLSAGVTPYRLRKTAARVSTGKGLRYAGPIHFGWPKRHIRPQPFLYLAGDRRIDRVMERYERLLALVIEEENG